MREARHPPDGWPGAVRPSAGNYSSLRPLGLSGVPLAFQGFPLRDPGFPRLFVPVPVPMLMKQSKATTRLRP